MDLKETLVGVFKGESRQRIESIFSALNKIGCQCKSDLKYLDEKMLESTNLLVLEKKKLLKYVYGMSLEEALEKIFGTQNAEKLKKIREYFRKEEVYTADDLAIFDLDKIKNDSSEKLTELDEAKIRKYIRKEHPDDFKDLREKEDHKKKIAEMKLEESEKKKQAKELQKEKHLESLYERQKKLSEDLSNVRSQFGELMNTQSAAFGSSNKSSGLSSSNALMYTKGSPAQPYLAGVVVVTDLLKAGSDLYGEYNRGCSNSSTVQALKERLADIERQIIENDKEIKKVLAIENVVDFMRLMGSEKDAGAVAGAVEVLSLE